MLAGVRSCPEIFLGFMEMRDSFSFKSENNGCSIYMSNIFYGHAPFKSGLFFMSLDSSDTHIHNVEAKRYKIVMIVPHTCGTAV